MRLIIFDLDNTLVRPLPGIKIPNTWKQQEIIPGVVEQCAKLIDDGVTLAIASNQGGVGLGICTLEDAQERVEKVATAIGAKKWMISIHHEGATRTDLSRFHMPYLGVAAQPFYRKPQPGMIFNLMMQLHTTAPETLFIGDQESDCKAATNAGVRFQWAKEFFGWS